LLAVVQRNPAATHAHVAAEETLRKALTETGRFRLLPAADTQLGLETARSAQWVCDGAPACMAQLSNVLGTRALLDLVIQPVTGGLRVEARLLDGTAVQKQATMVIPLEGAQQQAPLRRLARIITGESTELRVTAPVGAQVCVDAECFNATSEPVLVEGLAAGNHALKVSAGNEPAQEQTVTTQLLTPTRVSMPVKSAVSDGETPAAAPPPSHSKPWWGVACGAVVALTAWVAAAVMAGLAMVSGVVGDRAYAALSHGADGRVVAEPGQTRTQVEHQRNQAVLWMTLAGASGVVTGLLILVGLAGVAAAVGVAVYAAAF